MFNFLIQNVINATKNKLLHHIDTIIMALIDIHLLQQI